jgi:hypothetical protein
VDRVGSTNAAQAYIDPTAFPGTTKTEFWSSTPVAGSTTNGWYVSFLNGKVSTYAMTNTFNVRCVR